MDTKHSKYDVADSPPSLHQSTSFSLFHRDSDSNSTHSQGIIASDMNSISPFQGLNSTWILRDDGDFKYMKRFQHSFRSKGLCLSKSHAVSVNPITSTISNESTLILVRHGESMWNEKNLFTGCVDVPLTEKGVEEAIEAGKRIRNFPLDIIYTSALIRAQMTAMLALTEHHCMKVPIIVHKGTEQGKRWTKIYSEATIKQSIAVVKAWQLNERMYGDLQGYNKTETAEKYGKEQVHNWRRSYHVRPPNGESLEMCLGRAVSFFKEHIEPLLVGGKHVMVVAHANSLRSIIMYLDKLTSEEVIDLELFTGVPMLYIYKDGDYIRRGTPPGSSEAGVYAYTENLATYRQNLDEASELDAKGMDNPSD